MKSRQEREAAISLMLETLTDVPSTIKDDIKKAIMKSIVKSEDQLIDNGNAANQGIFKKYQAIIQDALVRNKGSLASIQKLPKNEQAEVLQLIMAISEKKLREVLKESKGNKAEVNDENQNRNGFKKS